MTQQAAPTTYCYRHPNREALVRCTRCDRPICPDCMRPASVGFQCPDDVSAGRRTVRAARTTVGAKLIQSPPYVTSALVAANVVVYIITATAPGASFNNPTMARSPGSLFNEWQLLPTAIRFHHRYYELITSAFLHVGLLHIGSNMLALVFIGPALEQLLGRWRFAVVYLLSALGGSAAVYAFGSEINPTVGASGAIFGLFGTCLVLVRRLGLDLQWLISIIALNFVLTFSISGISKLGHIGGFLTGILAALAIAGLPSLRRRIPTNMQIAGLTALFGLILLIVAVRTATWS